jgi:hypothetical protein
MHPKGTVRAIYAPEGNGESHMHPKGTVRAIHAPEGNGESHMHPKGTVRAMYGSPLTTSIPSCILNYNLRVSVLIVTYKFE